MEIPENTQHHVWCNFYFSKTPAQECASCIRLRREYPERGLSEKELATFYFPEAKRVSHG